MGGFFSSEIKMNDEGIKDLRKKLVDLERIDRNKDGIVTREELELWVQDQKRDLDMFKYKIEEMTKTKYEKELEDSQNEINNLKNR